MVDWLRLAATIPLFILFLAWHGLYLVFNALADGTGYIAIACFYTLCRLMGYRDDQVVIKRIKNDSY